jgi:hypothetical protein
MTNTNKTIKDLLNMKPSKESVRKAKDASKLNDRLGGVANMFGDNQAFHSKKEVLNWIEENKSQYTDENLQFVLDYVNEQYEKISRGEEIE